MFERKKKTLFAVTVLALILLISAAAGSVIADSGDRYRIILRYYDPIQITYGIKYPVGDSRGEWSGPEDVPIGGAGVPGAGKYEINPFISAQIYCVDPFTAFHSRVSDHDGSFDWTGGTMADIVYGYVSVAPWNMSGAMQANSGAVRWVAANGYRGQYNYGKPDSDPESVESIRRLNAMYPDIGPIDREIAVMATKVAVWKLVTGDSIKILKTTLDGRASKRETFDALVSALTADSLKSIQPGREPIPNEASVTVYNVNITEASGASYDEGIDATYDYFGPLSVSAALENAHAGGLSDMERVYLTVSGASSDGVRLVSVKSADPEVDLKYGRLFGTDRNERYITGTTGKASGNVWTSDLFYLAIPKNRAPARGDQLTMKAMAMVPNVQVAASTPVVYAFAHEGVQDWNAIQAFIGGASEGAAVDLYAEDSWYTGTTSLGDLYISKQVENARPDNSDRLFTFAVYYGSAGDDPARLNLTDYPVLGAFGADREENTFTLKNGGMALIRDLPAVVYGGDGDPQYEYNYWVEEIGLESDQNYGVPRFDVAIGKPQSSVNGYITESFKLDDSEGTPLAYVSVTNTYEINTGTITLSKRLAGTPADWGVDSGTVFTARVKDVTDTANEYYIRFELQPDGTYKAVGDSGSPTASNDTRELVRFTAARPVVLTDLWANRVYRVEETYAENCVTSYEGNGVSFPQSGSMNVAVTNTYDTKKYEKPGAYDLRITKTVTGTGSQTQLFEFEVINKATSVPLSFKSLNDENTIGVAVEISGSPDGRIGGENNTVIRLSHGETAMIRELPPGEYIVRELDPGRAYTTTHRVGAGSLVGALETAPFTLSGDITVAFINNIPTETEPRQPYIPYTPVVPNEPNKPNTPEKPDEPNEPVINDVPDEPDSPDVPDTHGEPEDNDSSEESQEHNIPEELDSYGSADEFYDTGEIEIDLDSDTQTGNGSPQTGDSRNSLAAVIMLILGAVCAAGFFVVSRRGATLPH